MSETAERAHVVLPGTTFGEIEGTITSLEGRVLRCDQAVPPAAGRSEIDVLRNLANRLGADQLDPTSRIPNFKVTPVHVGPVSPPDQPAEELQPLAADSSSESHVHDHTMTARGMA